MTQLISIDKLNPLELFTEKGGLDSLIGKVEEEARSFVPDMSTPFGREQIASMAYKIARSKTTLDKMGKSLVADWKEKSKAVDAERARAWDRLEALQKEIRQPLTDWENKEKARVEAHEADIVQMEQIAVVPEGSTCEAIQTRIDLLENFTREWEEFAARAAAVHKTGLSFLRVKLDLRQKYDAEQAELARLRQEEIERKQRERDERLKAEAAEKARKEAEAVAEWDRQAAIRREMAIDIQKDEADRRAAKAEANKKAAQEKAKKDREAAALKAKRDVETAAQLERDKITAEHKARAAEAARREADQKHRDKINAEIAAALVREGLDASHARIVVEVLGLKRIPHVSIQY